MIESFEWEWVAGRKLIYERLRITRQDGLTFKNSTVVENASEQREKQGRGSWYFF